jgi:hypothetical protein
VGDRLAAGVADGCDHLVGHVAGGSLAVAITAHIVHHHRGPVLRQQLCMRSAQAAAGACNQCDFAFK